MEIWNCSLGLSREAPAVFQIGRSQFPSLRKHSTEV